MRKKDNDSLALSMEQVMDSDQHRRIFQKPQVKTASVKEKKQELNVAQQIMDTFIRVSSKLEELGLENSSFITLKAAETFRQELTKLASDEDDPEEFDLERDFTTENIDLPYNSIPFSLTKNDEDNGDTDGLGGDWFDHSSPMVEPTDYNFKNKLDIDPDQLAETWSHSDQHPDDELFTGEEPTGHLISDESDYPDELTELSLFDDPMADPELDIELEGLEDE